MDSQFLYLKPCLAGESQPTVGTAPWPLSLWAGKWVEERKIEESKHRAQHRDASFLGLRGMLALRDILCTTLFPVTPAPFQGLWLYSSSLFHLNSVFLTCSYFLFFALCTPQMAVCSPLFFWTCQCGVSKQLITFRSLLIVITKISLLISTYSETHAILPSDPGTPLFL